MNKLIIYPGTFDPIHNGHIDIATRASRLFDELIFSVAVNSDKSPLFTVEERIEMIEFSTKDLGNVRACMTDKLVADFARETNAVALIRGLRHVSDFEFEFQMTGMNARLDSTVETVFLMASESHQFIASSLVKEIARLDGDINSFVSPFVADGLRQRVIDENAGN